MRSGARSGICPGVRSGMGYLGAATIPELWQRARFLRITTAGVRESHPHDVNITKQSPNYFHFQE